MKGKYYNIFKFFQNIYDKEILDIGKILGASSYGEVRDIKHKKYSMAGKIIENENEQESQKIKLAFELRGPNIIKIDKIYTEKYKGKYYNLVIMEKAILRDLGKLNEFYLYHNLLRLIYDDPFDEKCGDNLLRFYARQIINALEVLDRNDYIHLNIKPENLLVTLNLNIKLSDISFLRRVDDTSKLPKNIKGFTTPEYYSDKDTSSDIIKRQEYFALGECLFILKYGDKILRDLKKIYRNEEDILDLLIKKITFIKSNKIIDKDFINFLVSLIQFKPEKRPSFEFIYRNKWLNKNRDILHKIVMAFEGDEEKFIMELQKNDFIMKKEKQFKKNNNNLVKFRFKKR